MRRIIRNEYPSRITSVAQAQSVFAERLSLRACIIIVIPNLLNRPLLLLVLFFSLLETHYYYFVAGIEEELYIMDSSKSARHLSVTMLTYLGFAILGMLLRPLFTLHY